MQNLFRNQSITHATKRLGGEVLLIAPVSVWIVTVFLLVISASVITFLAISTFSRTETARGWLVPDAGIVRVTAMRPGIVSEILVSDGDQVEANQPIMIIRTLISTEEGDVGEALNTALETQQIAASQQYQFTQEDIENQKLELAQRRSNAQAELTAIEAQIRSQVTRIGQGKEAAERAIENWREGLDTRREADDRADMVLQLEQQLSSLRRSQSSIVGEISVIDRQITSMGNKLKLAQAERDSELASLSERSTISQMNNQFVVVSPIAGTIETLAVQTGQSVASEHTLAVASPHGSTLVAELYVPSRSIGFLEIGQPVKVKYEAFSFQTFGAGAATVVDVSRTILDKDEITFPGGLIQEPVFRVVAELERSTIKAYKRDIPLKNGMLLTADIVTDRRSLLEWLFDPLYAATE